MINHHRVVITGMGIWSCLGQSLEQVQESLHSGYSGIVYDPERKINGFESALTGCVPTPNLQGLLSRSQREYLPQQAQFAYLATSMAIKEARIDANYLQSNDVGLLYGNDSSVEPHKKFIDTLNEKHANRFLGAGVLFQAMNSTVSMNLSCLFGLRGISMTISAACASSSHAIGLGYLLIKEGFHNCIICGGAQEVNPIGVASFDGIGAFSKRESDPQKASRPFDYQRDGLVPGGGAATIVLEEYESAKKRNAPIIAEIIGYGFSSCGAHISSPNVEGPKKSILMALQQSKTSPSQIGYINAHATSTQIGDANEARAIYDVFGEGMPPVTSTKGQTGHEMWMAGASEIIYSILMMKNHFIAPNLNYEHGDEVTSKLNIPANLVNHHSFSCFLSNSFGFGGTNATLVIRDI